MKSFLGEKFINWFISTVIFLAKAILNLTLTIISLQKNEYNTFFEADSAAYAFYYKNEKK